MILAKILLYRIILLADGKNERLAESQTLTKRGSAGKLINVNSKMPFCKILFYYSDIKNPVTYEAEFFRNLGARIGVLHFNAAAVWRVLTVQVCACVRDFRLNLE